MIRKYLQSEVASGLIPAHHLEFVPYYLNRFKNGWLPAGVNKRKYIQKVTELAFRLFEITRCSPGKKAFYENEVIKLREDVKKILYTG